MIEFIISVGYGFGEVLTGGILVLHKLAYEIARRGYKVTIFTNPEYYHPNISVQKNSSENNLNFSYNSETTIIIPSFDWKNTSDIKNVARLALYHITSEQMQNVDENDEIFNFGSFNIPTDKITKQLTTLDYRKNTLVNRGLERTKKYCHILLKNNPADANEIISSFDSLNLDDYKQRGCFDYLADVFNEHEYFLTFDDKTFLTLAAAMCGCKPIILKNNNISPSEFREKNPLQKYGVAYGIDDLDWVEKTISKVPEYVDYMDEMDNKTIDEFIIFWENKLNK